MLAAVFSAAQTPTVESALKFTATTENIGNTHDSIEINLTRFSSDAESSQVVGAWTQYSRSRGDCCRAWEPRRLPNWRAEK